MNTGRGSLPARSDLGFAYALSVVVAVLVVISSLGGLLFGGRGLYESEDPRALPAFQGQDAISLLLGLPLLLGSLWFARRGSLGGMLVWMGVLFYFLYAHAYHVFGARFNPLFLVYLALTSLSLYALLALVANAEPTVVKSRFRPSMPGRLIGGFLMAMALTFGTLWVGVIIATLASGVAVDPVLRLVVTLDLMMPLSGMLLSGVLLWRRQPWGYVLSGPLLVMVTFYGFTLVAITLLSTFSGGPGDPLLIAYAIVGVGGFACSVLYFRAIERVPA